MRTYCETESDQICDVSLVVSARRPARPPPRSLRRLPCSFGHLRSLVTVSFCYALLVVHANCLFAQSGAVASDFDGDSTSDFVYVEVLDDAQGTLRWRTQLSASGQSTLIGDFGKVGDHITLSNLRGQGSNLGIVRADTQANSVTWMALNGSATEQVALGLASDRVVAGADFDGSGVSDIAAVEKRGAALIWKILRDPFSGGSAAALEVTHGRGKSKIFFASLDGSADWIGVVRRKGKRQSLHLKNAISGAERRVTLRKGAKNLSRTLVPVKSASGVDVLMSARASGAVTKLRFVGLDGKLKAATTFSSSGDIVVGDFDSSASGEEAALQTGSTVYVFNPFTQSTSTRTSLLQGLIAVDEVNINSFTSSGNGSGGSGGSGGPSSCDFVEPADGNGGFVWKPNSDTQHYAVAILPGKLFGFVSSVQVFTQSGTLIKELTYKGCANPDADGDRCAYQDYALTGRDYRNQYGSIVVKANFDSGGCYKYLISNPAQRVD